MQPPPAESDLELEGGYGVEVSLEGRRLVEEGRLPPRPEPTKASEPALVGSAAERVRRLRGAL